MTELRCQICGKPFFGNTRSCKYCSEACRQEADRRHGREYYAKNRQKPLPMIICLECNKPFPAERHAKYCPECKRAKAKAEYNELMKYMPKRARPQPKPKLSVSQIDKLAREAGMSYGHYIATHREEIERLESEMQT